MQDERYIGGTGESGSTLIELLMAVVLTGIILGALTGAIMSYFKGAEAIRYVATETPELQLAATRFASDVDSAAAVDTTASLNCGAAPEPGSQTLVKFSWTDPGPNPATTDDHAMTVFYVYGPTTHKLVRNACKDGSVVQQTTLVSHIKPSATPNVVTPATNQWDLALNVCTANECADAMTVIPVTLTGVRRSS